MEYSLKGRRKEERENNIIINKPSLLFKSLDSGDRRRRGRQLLLVLNKITSKGCYCPVPGTVTSNNSTRRDKQLQFNRNHLHCLSPSPSTSPPPTSTTTQLLHGVTYLSLFWATSTRVRGTIINSPTAKTSNLPFQPSLSHRYRHLHHHRTKITVPNTRGRLTASTRTVRTTTLEPIH